MTQQLQSFGDHTTFLSCHYQTTILLSSLLQENLHETSATRRICNCAQFRWNWRTDSILHKVPYHEISQSLEVVRLGVRMYIFPNLTFARRLRSPALKEKNVGGYRCYCGVQFRPHTLCSMCIDSYQFLPVTSSVMITCTCPFSTNDNHLQRSTILSSVICRYTGHHQSLHQPKFDQFCLQI